MTRSSSPARAGDVTLRGQVHTDSREALAGIPLRGVAAQRLVMFLRDRAVLDRARAYATALAHFAR